MPTDDTLGAALATMMQELADAIDHTTDKAQRNQLLAKQDEIHAKLQPLIDNTVNQNVAEYKEATAAVNNSITALKETQKDIGRIANSIEKLAKVVSALAKLASAIG
jgi:peptidoglycan hydrolase CwlO-like protein